MIEYGVWLLHATETTGGPVPWYMRHQRLDTARQDLAVTLRAQPGAVGEVVKRQLGQGWVTLRGIPLEERRMELMARYLS